MKPTFTMSQRVTTKRRYEAQLTGEQLIEMLNREIFRKDVTSEPIPKDAKVTFSVPGGGDWSNETIEIDERHPITVEWEVTTHE